MQTWKLLLALGCLAIGAQLPLEAHCQIPCGIYHDDQVFDRMAEDVQTMEKGIAELEKNAASTAQERNQMVRWIVLKDENADRIAHTIAAYFLQQRIKENDPQLDKKLKLAHSIMVTAMKIKQNVDAQYTKKLTEQLHDFRQLVEEKTP